MPVDLRCVPCPAWRLWVPPATPSAVAEWAEGPPSSTSGLRAVLADDASKVT